MLSFSAVEIKIRAAACTEPPRWLFSLNLLRKNRCAETNQYQKIEDNSCEPKARRVLEYCSRLIHAYLLRRVVLFLVLSSSTGIITIVLTVLHRPHGSVSSEPLVLELYDSAANGTHFSRLGLRRILMLILNPNYDRYRYRSYDDHLFHLCHHSSLYHRHRLYRANLHIWCGSGCCRPSECPKRCNRSRVPN